MLTKKQKAKKKIILKKINNCKQTKTFWWLFMILTFWTIVGLLIGIVGLVFTSERKNKYEAELVDFE